jgi:hypothetical protein
MPCTSTLIPDHLHWKNRKVYCDADYDNSHFLYRLGNPIEFPSTVTAYSCKWSFLIDEEDVLLAQDPLRYNDYRYAIVKEIRNYSFFRINTNDPKKTRWHKLTCFFNHSPEDCDYSHSEINIKHQIFEDENQQQEIECFYYNYENWKDALLNKNGAWFKQLRNDYKTHMIRLFCYP